MPTETNQTDWTKPQEATKLDVAFGGSMERLLPPKDAIPEDFWRDFGPGHKWRDIQRRWFFSGLPRDTDFQPKDGIDATAALRHLAAIQGSFAPKHEHKMAAVAWLMSLWFEDVVFPAT